MSTQSLKATCHCGAITVTVPRIPEFINQCDCSICHKYGAEWIYYPVPEVDIQVKEGDATKKYVWGDRMLEFHHCAECGCVVYWYPIPGMTDDNEMGVNSRMMERALLEGVKRKVIPPGE